MHPAVVPLAVEVVAAALDCKLLEETTVIQRLCCYSIGYTVPRCHVDFVDHFADLPNSSTSDMNNRKMPTATYLVFSHYPSMDMRIVYFYSVDRRCAYVSF